MRQQDFTIDSPLATECFIKSAPVLCIMLAAKTTLSHTQKVKEYLISKHLLHPAYTLVKDSRFTYFPLLRSSEIPHAKIIDTSLNFPKKIRPVTADDLLKDVLSSRELSMLPRTQEIVGTILILEIPPEMQKHEVNIALAYLKCNSSIKTVVRKDDIHSGEFRTRKVKILAGEKTTQTTHLESGTKITLDIERVYFSARSGHERLRIARLIRPQEKILVLFAGVAPFPLVIAKNSPCKSVTAVELNPHACRYAQRNIELNRMVDKISFICADARTITPTLQGRFDRIVMPLPKTGEDFLPQALAKVKTGGMIHLYAFLSEAELSSYRRHIHRMCRLLNKNIRIIRTVKCGQFSPTIFRVCLDINVLSHTEKKQLKLKRKK